MGLSQQAWSLEAIGPLPNTWVQEGGRTYDGDGWGITKSIRTAVAAAQVGSRHSLLNACANNDCRRRWPEECKSDSQWAGLFAKDDVAAAAAKEKTALRFRRSAVK